MGVLAFSALATILPATVLLATILPATPAAEAGKRQREPPPHAPGRALVGAWPGGRSPAARAVEAHGGRILSFYEPGDFFVVETPSRAPDWVRSLPAGGAVRYAELDFVVTADETYPTDPSWGSLWGMQKIGMPRAWDASTGSTSIVVGVIDTGVDYAHEDIGAAQMWTNPGEIPGNRTDDDGNGYVDDVYGADCRNNDGNPMDDHNHGTHVAGTIGAAANNGKGVVGVNWAISIMALKFLSSSGSGWTSDAVECLDYAIAKGAHLTSNSWGGGSYSQALYDAIKRARDHNQLFVAAAGNDGWSTDAVSPHYPSTYDLDNVVSVAATDSHDLLAGFSNYGPMTVDLAAPGVGVLSTVRGNSYASWSGTSMATPHVAGGAALLLARVPGASYRALLDRLYGSVDRLAGLEGKVATGGRLNVARAIEADVSAPGPTALSAQSSTRTSVSLAWTAPDEDGIAGGASPASTYELRYAPAGTTAWASAPAPRPAAPGTPQTATVAGLRPGTTYDLSLVARDNVGNASSASLSASTGTGAEVLFASMEGGAPGWTTQAPWAITPEHPHSPTSSWSDSPGTPYAINRDVSVTSAPFSLEGATNPRLSFWHRYNLEQGWDYASVYVSTDGGTSWSSLATYNGASDYGAAGVDLGPYAGLPDVRLRFRLTTDGSITLDGWFFDDILVSADGASLAISGTSASPDPFSPNGDAVKDATTISFSVNRAASWSVSVSERTWTGSTSGAAAVSVTWDGKNSGNAVVGDGNYPASVRASSGSETAAASTSVAVDTVPPSLSSIGSSNITSDGADIAWSTSEPSDSRVEYGITAGSYPTVASDGSLVTGHTVSLASLQADTIYYYRVTSADPAGNRSVSAEQSLRTSVALNINVGVAKVSQVQRKGWYWVGIEVTATGSSSGAAVPGATVNLKIGAGACPGGAAVFDQTATTRSDGRVRFTFKTRTSGSYCAAATVTAGGYNPGSGSRTFTVP